MVLNQDCGKFLDRTVEVVVDQLNVVTLGQLELAPGVRQPPLDRRLVFGAPARSRSSRTSKPGAWTKIKRALGTFART